MSSVWNCRWVADVPPRETSPSGDDGDERVDLPTSRAHNFSPAEPERRSEGLWESQMSEEKRFFSQAIQSEAGRILQTLERTQAPQAGWCEERFLKFFPFLPGHLPRICHQVAYTPRWKPPTGLKMCQNAATFGKGKKMAFSWKKLHKLAILCLNECPHTRQQQSFIAKLTKTCHLLFSTMGCSSLKYLLHCQRLHSVRWQVFNEVFQ